MCTELRYGNCIKKCGSHWCVVCVFNKRRVNYDARKTLLAAMSVSSCAIIFRARGQNSLVGRVSCAGWKNVRAEYFRSECPL